ncbi:MAG: hypothetical protein BroJett013_30290 [Alphaproteobacteria bacterium]|nr:MAG: hypothetical protein BroJett013_30290 [Alphaproteobacteria bacterium]
MSQSACSAYYVPRARAPAGPAPRPRTPAGRIVRLCGGPGPTAAFAEVTVKTVYRWLARVSDRGTGGRIPQAAQARLVANAQAAGIPIDFVDFAPRAGEAFQ